MTSDRNDPRAYDLVVLGATGFVGKLLAAYLAEHAPAHLRVALAGRSRERLDAVRSALPSAAARQWPLVVADATDAGQVADLARSTRVVVTTVGPYARYGLPLVRACAEAGTHYADLTGEVLFVRDALDAAHETAVRTGARIVTACGFDSVPSDLGVHLLHREAGGEGLGDTTLLVTRLSGGVSGGTVDSMRSQIDAVTADPSRQRVVFDPFALSADRPAEPDRSGQRDAMYVFRDQATGRWTAPWVMAAFNSRIVRRSDSLLGHAYGPRFRYREALGCGRGPQGRAQAYVVALAVGAGYTAMSQRLTRPLVDRVLPAPGEGPDEAARERGHFRVELRATTGTGRRLLAVVAAYGDPGYAATAVMLGQSALCLAEDGDRLSSPGGVLTPAVAMGDALVERLRNAGMTLTIGTE
ncbi:MAG: saccharopine dehydrogenase NADP-binding domain-containing protein [Lapillicoccus sp.]